MVVVETSSERTPTRILARGNFSLNANGLVSLLLCLGIVTLGLASVLAWNGYWPVLAIAAIQLVLVTWVLIRAWKSAWVFEEISLDADRIHIVHQQHTNRRCCTLESAWADVQVVEADCPWHSPRLVLRSRQQALELGRFLTREEKLQLAKSLSSALAEFTAWRNHRPASLVT